MPTRAAGGRSEPALSEQLRSCTTASFSKEGTLGPISQTKVEMMRTSLLRKYAIRLNCTPKSIGTIGIYIEQGQGVLMIPLSGLI